MKKKLLIQGNFFSQEFFRLRKKRSVTDRLWNEEEQSGWFDSIVSVVSFGYFSSDVAAPRFCNGHITAKKKGGKIQAKK